MRNVGPLTCSTKWGKSKQGSKGSSSSVVLDLMSSSAVAVLIRGVKWGSCSVRAKPPPAHSIASPGGHLAQTSDPRAAPGPGSTSVGGGLVLFEPSPAGPPNPKGSVVPWPALLLLWSPFQSWGAAFANNVITAIIGAAENQSFSVGAPSSSRGRNHPSHLAQTPGVDPESCLLNTPVSLSCLQITITLPGPDFWGSKLREANVQPQPKLQRLELFAWNFFWVLSCHYPFANNFWLFLHRKFLPQLL